jgi:hypothetical protein
LIVENTMDDSSSSFFTTPRIIIGLVVIGALVLACLVAGYFLGLRSVSAPTEEAETNYDAVKTESALTVVAQLTQSAPIVEVPEVVTATTAPPAVEPTQPPPLPTSTNTPVPSFTPVTPTATSTRPPATPVATFTITPVVNTVCRIDEQRPSYGDDFPKNADFDGNWKVTNTGSQTWSASAVDIKYISGTKFQVNGDIFDLPSDVAPNGQYTFIVDMKAPGSNGRYSTTWAIVQSGTTLCTLPLTIDVTD